MGKVLSRGFYVQKAFSVDLGQYHWRYIHLRDVATVLGRMSGNTEEERGLIGWRTENKRLVTPDKCNPGYCLKNTLSQKYVESGEDCV